MRRDDVLINGAPVQSRIPDFATFGGGLDRALAGTRNAASNRDAFDEPGTILRD